MKKANDALETYYQEPDRIYIIPKREGTCPECAVCHDPTMPHLPGSMYYAARFQQKHGRLPTWKDAMAHCAKPLQKEIVAWLKEKGVPDEDIFGKEGGKDG